jgi:tRNA(Arg) A34 adenosine deaminase TadA
MAAKSMTLEQLKDCTLYTSAEPCAMCSGAIYWAGLSARSISAITAAGTSRVRPSP